MRTVTLLLSIKPGDWEPGSRDVSVLSVQQDCKEHLLFSKNHNLAHGNHVQMKNSELENMAGEY